MAGKSCDDVCVSMHLKCTEQAWPQTLPDFQAVLETLKPDICQQGITAGDYRSNPQRNGEAAEAAEAVAGGDKGGAALAAVCYWSSPSPWAPRCELSAAAPDHTRFCPCLAAQLVPVSE